MQTRKKKKRLQRQNFSYYIQMQTKDSGSQNHEGNKDNSHENQLRENGNDNRKVEAVYENKDILIMS